MHGAVLVLTLVTALGCGTVAGGLFASSALVKALHRVPAAQGMGPMQSIDAVEGTVSVAIVDDHVVVRAGLRMLLEAQSTFQVVAEAADVASTVEVVSAHRPSILLLDLNLPDGSALEALPAISAASPHTRIVVLTMQEGAASAARALAEGASGYLLKEAAATELLDALHAVAAGRSYLDPRLGAAMAANGLVTSDERLTGREREVLRLLALGSTNSQVAQRLHFSERTIEACRAEVRRKLGLRDRAALTEYARANGLLD
jgi:two-component system, NarL family, response regulator NreC